MKYSHTTIDFSSWPDDPMFMGGDEPFIATTIHLTNDEPMLVREIDVSLTVG